MNKILFSTLALISIFGCSSNPKTVSYALRGAHVDFLQDSTWRTIDKRDRSVLLSRRVLDYPARGTVKIEDIRYIGTTSIFVSIGESRPANRINESTYFDRFSPSHYIWIDLLKRENDKYKIKYENVLFVEYISKLWVLSDLHYVEPSTIKITHDDEYSEEVLDGKASVYRRELICAHPLDKGLQIKVSLTEKSEVEIDFPKLEKTWDEILNGISIDSL